MLKVQDFEWAEKYCMDVHAMKGFSEQDVNPVWITLLEICVDRLASNPAPQPFLYKKDLGQFALYILNKHAKNIDPIHSLNLLPTNMKLTTLDFFTQQVCVSTKTTNILQIIRSSHFRQRQYNVLQNMSKIHLMKCRSLVSKGVSQRIVIKANSLCPVCRKHIGEQSVFVVYPDNTVVHVKCADKTKQIHPVSGLKFNRFPVSLQEIPDQLVLFPPKSV